MSLKKGSFKIFLTVLLILPLFIIFWKIVCTDLVLVSESVPVIRVVLIQLSVLNDGDVLLENTISQCPCYLGDIEASWLLSLPYRHSCFTLLLCPLAARWKYSDGQSNLDQSFPAYYSFHCVAQRRLLSVRPISSWSFDPAPPRFAGPIC